MLKFGVPLKLMMMLHFFMNSGVTNSDGSESYMFGNYSERDVDGGFYYRNPDGRDGVLQIL